MRGQPRGASFGGLAIHCPTRGRGGAFFFFFLRRGKREEGEEGGEKGGGGGDADNLRPYLRCTV